MAGCVFCNFVIVCGAVICDMKYHEHSMLCGTLRDLVWCSKVGGIIWARKS